MATKTSQDIRRGYINYFLEHNHSAIASSSVIPHDDPTLLFINAGMNQFKDVFLGDTVREYTRAVSSQKCIRVGGKHNDLENVGHTKRHLTLFEMMGNFSFGDYFKKEAIHFSWEVSTNIFGFDPERIWPSVFLDDEEAFDLWTAYVPAERITRMDEKDNFWAMGDTGPCGPCSELYYDRGPQFGEGTNPANDPTGDRFMEFWNLVFMQYNRDSSGVMHPLPKPSIDTGAGLERVMSLIGGVDSVFETDVLRELIAATESTFGKVYDPSKQQQAAAFRVIADHLRCLAFAIADGAQPSNVERGYVLRKVLRRAVRYGRQLSNTEKPFLGKILPRLTAVMGEDYPELVQAQSRIEEILHVEEEAFLRTLNRGKNLLSQIISQAHLNQDLISGDDAFKLKDTYGFPIDEIHLIAKDADLKVELKRYEELEREAKERSRAAHKSTEQQITENVYHDFSEEHEACVFVGFDEEKHESVISGLFIDGKAQAEASVGDRVMIILAETPFYAEKGGQIGDQGEIICETGTAKVQNTQNPYTGIIVHQAEIVTGTLRAGDAVSAVVEAKRRHAIANNHTATHLLHWALHQVLGDHVKQAGSVVDQERLRFDFNHHKALTPGEIEEIENLVNEAIRTNSPVKTFELSYEEAQKNQDIKQFFGDKYGKVVRVVDINFSKELCGGTHAKALGHIGYFRIASEGSIAAGVRRIEAITGSEAEALARKPEEELQAIAELLKTQKPKLQGRLLKLLEENQSLKESLADVQNAQRGDTIKQVLEKKEDIHGIDVIAEVLAIDPKEMKDTIEETMKELKSGVVVLACIAGERCQIAIRISDDLVSKGIKAQDCIKVASTHIDGKGGGKANAAQAGGTKPSGVQDALSAIKELLATVQVC
jgi:alanyl-tRNA synthetase